MTWSYVRLALIISNLLCFFWWACFLKRSFSIGVESLKDLVLSRTLDDLCRGGTRLGGDEIGLVNTDESWGSLLPLRDGADDELVSVVTLDCSTMEVGATFITCCFRSLRRLISILPSWLFPG